MTQKWGSCNLAGVKRIIGFKAGLFNCRVSGLLEQLNAPDRKGRSQIRPGLHLKIGAKLGMPGINPRGG